MFVLEDYRKVVIFLSGYFHQWIALILDINFCRCSDAQCEHEMLSFHVILFGSYDFLAIYFIL